MLNNSVIEFRKNINELKGYIDFIEQSEKVLLEAKANSDFGNREVTTLLKSLNSFRTKSTFEYNSFVISLYGSFERFIENILGEYLSKVSICCTKFDDLPDSIKRNHLPLTTDLIKNLDYPKYRGLDAKKIIKILNGSLNTGKATINNEAFQHHAYNFKVSVITDYFKQVGIEGISKLACNYEPLKAILAANNPNFENVSLDIVLNTIDDLALRRNDVAHGVDNIIILGRAVITDYIVFIESFAISLSAVLENNLMKFKTSLKPIELETINVFNHEILAARINNQTLTIGDEIIVKRTDAYSPQYIIAKILSIEISSVSYNTITVTEPIDVAIRISEKIKRNYSFFLNLI